MRRNIYRLVLVLTSVSITLLLGEVILRITNVPKPAVSGWRVWKEFDNLEKNQFSYRGQQIEYSDEDFVVVLLGDSQVEARACSFEWMPERRLQHYLGSTGRRVKVFSVAVSAWGQDQELLALREYFEKYRADLVVLWETPTNDIWNNIFPTSFPADGQSKPTFWLEGGQLRGPSEGIGQPIRETPKSKLLLLFRKNFGWSRDREWERLYPPAYKPTSEPDGPVKEDWQQSWDNKRREFRDQNLATEKAHVAMFLTPRSERMQYGLDLTRALLHEIQSLAGAHGARFVTFALSNRSEESDFPEGLHVLNGKYYKTSVTQYRDNIGYVNQGFNSYLIPVTVEQWRVGSEDSHLNEHATDQVMIDLAGRLESFIPASATAGKSPLLTAPVKPNFISGAGSSAHHFSGTLAEGPNSQR